LNSFVKFYNLLDNRVVTEFSYRMSQGQKGHIICSFLLRSNPSSASGPSPAERSKEIGDVIKALNESEIEASDLSENEFAKSHVRHLVGGRGAVDNERIFRFGKLFLWCFPNIQLMILEFPERFGALANFLRGLKPDWNISLFHYRNHGADVGKVLVGLQVPANSEPALNDFLEELGYPFVEETQNEAYRNFLSV
jgi:threonine dehydratase